MTTNPIVTEQQALNNDQSQRKGFFRALSRKTVSIQRINSITFTRDSSKYKRGDSIDQANLERISRRRSICNRLVKSKDEPRYGSRAKTGTFTLAAKQKVLNKYPGLQVEYAPPNDYAIEHVLHGPNSIFTEVIDMNSMVLLMQENSKMLSHRAVERFFEWLPLFSVFLERYMHIEEDLIVRWVESRADTLRGDLRPSVRMVSRGRIQKGLRDIIALQERFRPHIPAGQLVGEVVDAVDSFTNQVIEFFARLLSKLPDLIRDHFSKTEVEKNRTRMIKHLVSRVGYQDFLALYTRWMRPGQLLEWRTTVLLPCDFKFFSYFTWERDMNNAHYQIASQYGEMLESENREDMELNRQGKVDFERARATRNQMTSPIGMNVAGIDVEITQEEEIVEDDNE